MSAKRNLPVPFDDLRTFGTKFDGASFFIRSGWNERVLGRHLYFDQDIDGSWSIIVDRVGPGDHDDRPPEASISVYDPAVTAFLERLHQMMSDPVGFGHQTVGEKPEAADTA